MNERKRQTRLKHVFDRTMKEHWIFVYNNDRQKVAELIIDENGWVVVTQGVLTDCPANRDKIKERPEQA